MAKIGQPPDKGSATAAGPNMNPPPYAEGKPKVVKDEKWKEEHMQIFEQAGLDWLPRFGQF